MRIAVKQDRSTDKPDGVDRLGTDQSTYGYLIYYKGDPGRNRKRWTFQEMMLYIKGLSRWKIK